MTAVCADDIDLELFQGINDQHVTAGDRVLIESANRLQGVAAESIPSPEVGGDEFVLGHSDRHNHEPASSHKLQR